MSSWLRKKGGRAGDSRWQKKIGDLNVWMRGSFPPGS